MTNAIQPVMLPAAPPSQDEAFYVAWGQESLKSNLVFANEVLRQLLTLNTTLLGGSVAVLDAPIINAAIRNVAILVFFVSLVVSFLGIMPYEGMVNLRVPAEVRLYKQAALRCKRRYLMGAAGLIALGFGIVFVGLLVS